MRVKNISYNVGPMMKYFNKVFKIPYFFIKLFGFRDRAPNFLAAGEMVRFGERDLVRYNIFTAIK